ncbi:MAG: hypothetical protein D6770_07370, partial [Anaerolineae bacterium]
MSKNGSVRENGWPLPPDFGERINRRVREALRHAFPQGMEGEAAWPLPPDFGARINRQVQEALRRAGVTVGSWSDEHTARRDDERPAPETGVTEEERLRVLRMLAEKKITLDEAEALLRA